MELAASLWLIAPEVLLGTAALLLVLVAAWGGDKASCFISIASCFVLGAAFFLVAPAVCAGAAGSDTVAFYGQIRADAFAGMAKLMIYAAAGAALVVAPAYFERLNAMRERFAIGVESTQVTEPERIREAAQRIALRTLRTASGAAVPAVPNDPGTVIISFARLRNLEVVDRFDLPTVMEQAIADSLPNAQMLTISSDPLEDEIVRAKELAAGASTLVICTRDAIQHQYQQEIGKGILAQAPDGASIFHVNLRGPYDVGLLGDVDETIFTFGDAVVSLRALAAALSGKD